MRLLRSRRTRFVLLAAAAAGVAAGGAAYASIPDAGGVIHGCYAKLNGSLRVVDTQKGQRCSSSETPLNWSEKGATGAKGPTGPRGPVGITGPRGPSGQRGPTGPSGLSHALFATADNVAVPQGLYGRVLAMFGVSPGPYMIIGQVSFADGLNSTDEACEVQVNGSTVPNSQTLDHTDNGEAALTIVTTATLTGLGSAVEVDCNAADSSTSARTNLTLVAISALN